MIRIVYDGAPEAGKTTNVQQLSSQISLSRRGAYKAPGTTGRRTEFFDWLDFSGGFLDGRRVRCQLVSVPGQPSLLHRRRYLLEAADAIVFVADSRTDVFKQSSADLKQTMRIVERVSRGVPVGLVLQANKQDLPGAASPDEVARALDVDKLTPVVGSVASSGEGVMQTFVLAVRLATDRVRGLLMLDPSADLPTAEDDPDALHASMLAREPAPATLPPQSSAEPPATTRPPPRRALSEMPARLNPLAAHGDVPPLPNAMEIASGHVWPPVKGRGVIAIATSGAIDVPEMLRPWAPRGAIEVHGERDWILHTSERWVYDSEQDARRRLLAVVRSLVDQPTPEGRCVALAKDGERFRLWVVTPRVTSLMEDLATEGPAFTQRVASASWSGRSVQFGAHGVALQDDRLVILALDEEGDGASARDPLSHLELAAARMKEAG